jgi:hypothetical protein
MEMLEETGWARYIFDHLPYRAAAAGRKDCIALQSWDWCDRRPLEEMRERGERSGHGTKGDAS